MIARAKGNHFLVYHGAENISFDAKPEQPAVHRSHHRVEHSKV